MKYYIAIAVQYFKITGKSFSKWRYFVHLDTYVWINQKMLFDIHSE